MTTPLLSISNLPTDFIDSYNEFTKELSEEIAYIKTFNTSKHPYHSTAHLIGVASILYYWLTKNKDCRFQYSLTLAGLFHDFNYAGDHDDSVNIAAALEGFEKFSSHRFFPADIKVLTEEFIKATFFSFDEKVSNPWPLADLPDLPKGYESIIREADQLYARLFLVDNPWIYEGLYEEIGVRFGQTYEAFAVRNLEYSTNDIFTRQEYKELYQSVKSNLYPFHFERYREGVCTLPEPKEKIIPEYVDVLIPANRVNRVDENFPAGVKLISAKVLTVTAGVVFGNITAAGYAITTESNQKFLKYIFTAEEGEAIIEGKLILAPESKVAKVDLTYFPGAGNKGIVYNDYSCLVRFEIVKDPEYVDAAN